MDIGGYLGLEEFMGKEYYPDLIALNTGRNALACLIHAKHIRKLYIPNYLCDSVFRVCEREECPYEFYEVGADFLPKFEKALGNGEWIYIVNYFGQILNERELKKKYDRIIFDNAQAFFRNRLRASAQYIPVESFLAFQMAHILRRKMFQSLMLIYQNIGWPISLADMRGWHPIITKISGTMTSRSLILLRDSCPGLPIIS